MMHQWTWAQSCASKGPFAAIAAGFRFVVSYKRHVRVRIVAAMWRATCALCLDCSRFLQAALLNLQLIQPRHVRAGDLLPLAIRHPRQNVLQNLL